MEGLYISSSLISGELNHVNISSILEQSRWSGTLKWGYELSGMDWNLNKRYGEYYRVPWLRDLVLESRWLDYDIRPWWDNTTSTQQAIDAFTTRKEWQRRSSVYLTSHKQINTLHETRLSNLSSSQNALGDTQLFLRYVRAKKPELTRIRMSSEEPVNGKAKEK